MINKKAFLRSLLAAAAALTSVAALATDLYVEVGSSYAPGVIDAAIQERAFKLSRNVAVSSLRARTLGGHGEVKPFLPTRVILTRNGVPLPMAPSAGIADLVPTFDAVGPRVFPANYQTLLEDVFTEAKSTMNAVFGMPKDGGTIKIKNYDVDIQDRYAVAGGIYVPNAPGGPEIHFPVYLNEESAAVNYVHTLLLAYAGDAAYPWDVFSEGLARAATMRVVRTPSALPAALDLAQVEATLEATYDQSSYYDWYNQPALGGPSFIAPNLIDEFLPVGGSTGGIFLLRYQMAGTAWLKVLTQYPAFASEFNSRFYLNPAAYQTHPTLNALAQEVIDFLAGGAGAKVEGYEFADWALRQYIFDTDLTAGTKVLVQALPVPADSGSSDFGVYGIILNAFKTATDGDETFLAGTSYPIYFRPDFTRFFVTAQDDAIPVVGAYGSVVPNFPSDTFGGDMYRVTVDVPFAGHLERVTVPAGGFSTGSNPFPNNFFGTVSGIEDPGADSYVVEIDFGGLAPVQVPVVNQAFGTDITDSEFDKAKPTTIKLLRDDGQNQTLVYQIDVNKGFGSLAIDLKSPNIVETYDLNTVAGLDMIGVPVKPFRPSAPELLGLSVGDTLLARWNPVSAAYDLFPDIGHFLEGFGFYARPPVADSLEVDGWTRGVDPVAVMLQPGWNMITVPFEFDVDIDDLQATVATEAFASYALAKGDSLGLSIFGYTPLGGNPDSGILETVTTLEPGKAYFVRALRPEGAVLLLTPPAPPTPSLDLGGGGSLFEGGLSRLPGSWGGGGFTQDRSYTATVTLSSYWDTLGQVVIGQKRGGFRGIDFREDVDLPPGISEIKMGVVNDLMLFQDVRSTSAAESFEIRIEGLEPGKRYSLSIKDSNGYGKYRLVQGSTGKRFTSYGFSSFSITARSESETILVTKEGF